MTRIFISYRRADSEYITDSIYEHLAREFGEDGVFLDVGDIPVGVDFRAYIAEQIAAHDVLLVIIGTDWERQMQERGHRHDDLVRLEIESAIEQDKLIIPVMVKGAKMPDFSQLPQSIADLQWRNSAIIRRVPDFREDCQRLIDGIKATRRNDSHDTILGMAGILSEDDVPTTKVPIRIVNATTRPLSQDALAMHHILPTPFEWCHVPAGRVVIEAFGVVQLNGFAMAKYPITNGQYATFMAAGGYDSPRWWQFGWAQRQDKGWQHPLFWDDDAFNAPYQPVVGISWYEALAFCRWLGETAKTKIMLPTESQWQYAAQGDDHRVYPWGNDWDEARANMDGAIGASTDVTRYSGLGNSPFGAADMSGNVFEWCINDPNSPDLHTLHNADSEAARALRGGSWREEPALGRCRYRAAMPPLTRDNETGFRVCHTP